MSRLEVISGPREQDWGRGLSALRSQAVDEGSERGAGGYAVRRLGVISGPRDQDWGVGPE